MRDDYLWDKTGLPDPEVGALEETLGALRFDERPLVLDEPRPWRAILLAAALMLAVGGWWALRLSGPPAAGEGWAIATLDGAPVCEGDCLLSPGEWIETVAGSSARLTVADIGEMDLAPETRLRLVASGPEQHKLELARGVVTARVVAPPRLLVVDTPSASAVDLGCIYTLTVTDDGASELTVMSGWVSLESPSREVVVPAGARALSRTGVGPGTPHFVDTSNALRDALERFDFHGDAAALQTVLAEARPRDGLTLLYAAARLDRSERGDTVTRLLALVPALEPLGQDALEELGPGTFDAALGLLIQTW